MLRLRFGIFSDTSGVPARGSTGGDLFLCCVLNAADAMHTSVRKSKHLIVALADADSDGVRGKFQKGQSANPTLEHFERRSLGSTCSDALESNAATHPDSG